MPNSTALANTPTRLVGIGYLIVSGDPEHGKPAGTKVTDKRVQELFTQDNSIALEDCRTVFPNFGSFPQEGQRVLAIMMFNLGRPRFIKFTKCIAAVKDSKWDKAADEMVDSKWYSQVKGRAPQLEERMPSEDEDCDYSIGSRLEVIVVGIPSRNKWRDSLRYIRKYSLLLQEW